MIFFFSPLNFPLHYYNKLRNCLQLLIFFILIKQSNMLIYFYGKAKHNDEQFYILLLNLLSFLGEFVLTEHKKEIYQRIKALPSKIGFIPS